MILGAYRALEIIAAHPNGCTEAMLVAHDIPADADQACAERSGYGQGGTRH